LELALLTRLRGGPITEIGATWPGSLRGGELRLKEFNVGYGNIGVAIRDHSWGVIATAHSFVSHVVDAPMAEAYALKECLLLAKHIGSNRLAIQADCMAAVETMKEGGFSANLAVAIYNECSTYWSGF
jgi:hypothetical protein